MMYVMRILLLIYSIGLLHPGLALICNDCIWIHTDNPIVGLVVETLGSVSACINNANSTSTKTCDEDQSCITFTGDLEADVDVFLGSVKVVFTTTYRACTASKPENGFAPDDSVARREVLNLLSRDITLAATVTLKSVDGATCVCNTDQCNGVPRDLIVPSSCPVADDDEVQPIDDDGGDDQVNDEDDDGQMLSCIECIYTEDSLAGAFFDGLQIDCIENPESAVLDKRICAENEVCIMYSGVVSVSAIVFGSEMQRYFNVTYRNCTITSPTDMGLDKDKSVAFNEIGARIDEIPIEYQLQVTNIEGASCVCNTRYCNNVKGELMTASEQCQEFEHADEVEDEDNGRDSDSTPGVTVDGVEESDDNDKQEDSVEQNNGRGNDSSSAGRLSCLSCWNFETDVPDITSILKEALGGMPEDCLDNPYSTTNRVCPEQHMCLATLTNFTISGLTSVTLNISMIYRDCVQAEIWSGPGKAECTDSYADVLENFVENVLLGIEEPSLENVETNNWDAVTCLCEQDECNGKTADEIKQAIQINDQEEEDNGRDESIHTTINQDDIDDSDPIVVTEPSTYGPSSEKDDVGVDYSDSGEGDMEGGLTCLVCVDFETDDPGITQIIKYELKGVFDEACSDNPDDTSIQVCPVGHMCAAARANVTASGVIPALNIRLKLNLTFIYRNCTPAPMSTEPGEPECSRDADLVKNYAEQLLEEQSDIEEVQTWNWDAVTCLCGEQDRCNSMTVNQMLYHINPTSPPGSSSKTTGSSDKINSINKFCLLAFLSVLRYI